MKKIFLSLVLVVVGWFGFAYADQNQPADKINRDAVGQWLLTDKAGNAVTKFEITRRDNLLYGRVIEVYQKEHAVSICDKCIDDRKDQKALGMEIIRNAKKVADDWDWKKGSILDPESGKNYKLRMWTSKDGKTLSVRGYFGPFYMTHHWQRVTEQTQIKAANIFTAK